MLLDVYLPFFDSKSFTILSIKGFPYGRNYAFREELFGKKAL